MCAPQQRRPSEHVLACWGLPESLDALLTELSLHFRALDALGRVQAVQLVQGLLDGVGGQLRHHGVQGGSKNRAAELWEAGRAQAGREGVGAGAGALWLAVCWKRVLGAGSAMSEQQRQRWRARANSVLTSRAAAAEATNALA